MSPRPLPTYGLRAAPRAFESMGAELSALHTRVHRSHRLYGVLSVSAAAVIFVASLAVVLLGGPLVSGGVLLLFAIGVGLVWVVLLRAVLASRKAPAGSRSSLGCVGMLLLLILPVLALGSAIMSAASGAPLALFDLSGDLGSLVPLVGLATLGVLSGAMIVRWQLLPETGPLNEHAAFYASALVVPLVRDAAVGSQPSAEVCIQEPARRDWVRAKEGQNRRRTFVRPLASVHVPLELGEHVHVRVREEVHVLWRVQTSASGRIKTKQRGSDRRTVAEISWRLRVRLPGERDLSGLLRDHLRREGALHADVDLRARGSESMLRARLSMRERSREPGYAQANHWIDPRVVLSAVRFLSTQRAHVSVR